MINFNFASTKSLLDEITRLISVSYKNMKFVEDNGGYSDPRVSGNEKNREALQQSINSAIFVTSQTENIFSSLESVHISEACRRLRAWFSGSISEMRWSELNTRARALRDIMDVELGQYKYYQYPKEKSFILEIWERDWAATIASFESSRDDIFSAIDLWALGHSTGCVFYLMRVLEYGLRA